MSEQDWARETAAVMDPNALLALRSMPWRTPPRLLQMELEYRGLIDLVALDFLGLDITFWYRTKRGKAVAKLGRARAREHRGWLRSLEGNG